MVYVFLLEPQTPGNIGSVARVMKNFGYSKLYLINPQCGHLADEAMARAKHAKNLLKKAVILDNLKTAKKKVHTLVGTTAQLGTDYNVPRSPLTPTQFAEIVKKNTGILFGRESSGLSNDEVQLCDLTLSIPATPKYTTLNLSHAVGIVLYELYKSTQEKKFRTRFTQASRRDKEQVMLYITKVLNTMMFSTKDKKATQKKVWTRILGKSFLTKREAFAMIGFFKKLLKP